MLMPKVRVDYHVLRRGNLIVDCKLRGRGANIVHQAAAKQHLCLDPIRQVLQIDIPKLFKDRVLTRVGRVKVSKVFF